MCFSIVGCNLNNKEPLTLSETNLVLDKYAEYDITVKDYDGVINWASSDESLLTVSESGHLSCLGKIGDVTITATSGNKKGSCSVSIKNQGKNPSISVTDVLGFVDEKAKFEPQVRYDDEYYPLLSFSLTSSDSDICRIENGNEMFGVSKGNATITIDGTWKTKELNTKTFNIEIKENKAIVLDNYEFDIYSVDNTSTVKSNSVTVTGKYYEKGEVTDKELFVVLPNNDYLSSNGPTISVFNSYDSKDSLSINGKVKVSGVPDVEEDITIHLHSNFFEKDGSEELVKQPSAKINIEKGQFGGREDVTKYEIVNDPINQNPNNPQWSNWESRIEFYETTTKNGISAYSYLVESGIEILSFDFYYTGVKGFLMGSYGKGSNSYYYNDIQTNNSDILVVDSSNYATNTIVQNTWMTAYIKIKNVVQKSMEAGQDAATIYVSSCFVGDCIYFDNIRYYYDLSKLNTFDISFDNIERSIVEDANNVNKGTSDNEMFVYGPNFINYTSIGNNTYSYVSTNETDPLRLYKNKISPENLITGRAINLGYKYFAFKYKYISGNPLFYIYDLSQAKYLTYSFKSENTFDSNLIYIFKDGRPVDTFLENEVVDIVIRIDQTANESMYITTTVASEFEIGNFTYYKNESFYEDLSKNELIRIYSSDVDLCFIDEQYNLKDLITVMYGSSVSLNYIITNIHLSDDSLATISETTITLINLGNLIVSFKVVIDNQEKEYSINFNIVQSDYVTIFNDDLELYCGATAYFPKTVQLNVNAVKNQTPLSISDLTFELINNSGIVSISKDGLVTGIKVGEDEIKVSFINGSDVIFDTIKVVVFDTYRRGSMVITQSDATNPATYIKNDAIIGGLDDVWTYSASTASWSNHLDVEETSHVDKGASYQNIVNKPIKYISYDIMLNEGTTGRIASVAPSGKHLMLKLEAGKTVIPASEENANIKFYSASGEEVTTLLANTWYKVVINYSNFMEEYNNQFSTLYTCNEFSYVKGTIYFHDIRYYHDVIPNEDLRINL